MSNWKCPLAIAVLISVLPTLFSDFRRDFMRLQLDEIPCAPCLSSRSYINLWFCLFLEEQNYKKRPQRPGFAKIILEKPLQRNPLCVSDKEMFVRIMSTLWVGNCYLFLPISWSDIFDFLVIVVTCSCSWICTSRHYICFQDLQTFLISNKNFSEIKSLGNFWCRECKNIRNLQRPLFPTW